MAGTPRFEIPSSSSDGSNFPGYCNGQRGHFSTASNMERSSSFRENFDSRILTAGANFPRGSTSVHGEHLPLSQVLLLDTLSMGDQKYPRYLELKRVTNAVVGNVAEDPSLGPVQSKQLCLLGPEELKRLKSCVTENSLKARERIKFLNEAISKLDKYRSPMLPRKRTRTEPSAPNALFSVDRSALGGNLLKAGPQNHTASICADLGSQRPDDRKSTVPNKRVRTSMMDMRVDGRPNNLPRPPGHPPGMTDRERDILRSGNAASQLEDKDRTLPAGSESWEKTKMKGRRSGMKSDVSVNAVANRMLDGDRDYKRGIQQRPSTESRSRPSEGHGFRSGPVHGIVNMHNKMENSSQPGGLNVRALARNESDCAIPANEKRDRFVGSEKDRTIPKNSIKPNVRDENHAVSPTTITKGKASRAPRSGSGASANSSPNVSRTSPTFDSWERTSNPNRSQITAGSNSRKRPFPTGSSSAPVAQWAEQKPPKNQRTKRSNLVPPVSNRDDVPNLVEASSNPESVAKPDSTESNGQGFLRRSSNNSALQQSRLKTENISSLAAFSESEESGAGDKCKDKNKKQGEADEKIAPVSQKAGSLVLPPKKTKTVVKEESGDGVRRQGRSGRASTPLRVNVPPSGKLENPPTTKQLRSTRPGTDKVESKTGRPPTKKTSLDRKPVTRLRRPMNNGLSDFTGESDDDREELLVAANAAINASDAACSGPFWKQVEPYFAFLTQADLDLLKQLVRDLDDADATLRSPSGSSRSGKVDLISSNLPANLSQRSLANGCVDNESLRPSSSLNAKEEIEKPGKCRWLDKMLPLSQRLLSALIVEEDSEEANRIIYDGTEDDCVHYTSDDSPRGNCTQIESETRNAGKPELEIEPEVETKNWKHHTFDYSNHNSHFANGHQNYTAENICSDDFMQDDIVVHSEVLSFNAEFRGLDERYTHGGRKNQDGLKSNCQTFGLISGIAAYDIDIPYQEMDLNQRIFLELQSIGLVPESVPDLAHREDEEIKEDIYKLKDELQQQVSKNKGHAHKLEKAVFKGQKDEERDREMLAMNKLAELAYNRHMGRGTNASGAKSAGNKVTKQATLGFVKRTLAKFRMFDETGKSCFSDAAFKEKISSISSKEMDKKLLGDAVEGDAANVLAENAHALSDIKTSANSAPHSEQAARIVTQHTPKLENGDRELCNSVQGTASYPEQTVVKDEVWSTRVKKRELLLEEVNGSGILKGAASLGTSLLGGAKGKRTERDREGKVQTKEILTRSGSTRSGRPGLGNAKGERKNKPKPRQKTAQLSAAANGLLGKPAEAPKPSLTSSCCEKPNEKLVKVKDELPASQNSIADDDVSHDNGPIDLSHLQLPNMEDFSVTDDMGGQAPDLGSWLNFEDDNLPDAGGGDLMGLAVPMDDLADLKMF
ncbi:hypothetical protein SUGI_1193220 [Cryptomeria japonica]|uniref:uncharacterized protein LOC131063180 n=1 Tax=Cryptomeria japonica TaxID=3369 RepID=UPI002414C216|nr:uncharacterized protein LOC131063180 [Cryptomeria japonica]XP_057852953.1 uncharacterized protein LOC131063180 [Cryptomeria japonica]XP_057852954.1 uncharacterized protein LOC131063180 [Cryptomeria japonica]XP_057852955.1 uncharacterized protein LOC131063180 [Cryptomeria japonica]GLJ55556.1 hypothetical protein SUGI_1193220 [Cryptomeria japonica]